MQLFNFAVLPPSARVLFVSSVAIAWCAASAVAALLSRALTWPSRNGFLSVQGHTPAPAAAEDARTSQTLRTPQVRAN